MARGKNVNMPGVDFTQVKSQKMKGVMKNDDKTKEERSMNRIIEERSRLKHIVNRASKKYVKPRFEDLEVDEEKKHEIFKAEYSKTVENKIFIKNLCVD